MDINGLQKLTLLDYPEKVACTVFLAGCNLRCPFCHNAPLVTAPAERFMTEAEFLEFLRSRTGKLDGVCVTGGEPTLRRELPDFLKKIRALGLSVKLDTNGTNPNMLQQLLDGGLVDYVAMDIKGSPRQYDAICGGVDVLEAVAESAALLMEYPGQYEFRTTCVHPFHDEKAMADIGSWLEGAEKYYLQNFVDSGRLVGSGVTGLTKDEMEALRSAVLPRIPNTRIRGL